MKFFERYLAGDTKAVYDEIEALDAAAFQPENIEEIEKVLNETFSRVAYNLKVIYKALQEIDYKLKTEFKHSFEKPLQEPFSNTETLLDKLKDAVKPFGYIPLSLQYFYKYVGGVNFVWDFENHQEFMWSMADPIEIFSLDDLTSYITREVWPQEMQPYIKEKKRSNAFIELSGDDLHKDNASGGLMYALMVTTYPSIDSSFIHSPYQTTFIDYLRICFKYCGFPGIAYPEHKNDYQDFFAIVKPQLKPI